MKTVQIISLGIIVSIVVILLILAKRVLLDGKPINMEFLEDVKDVINPPLEKVEPIFDPDMGGPFSEDLLCDFKGENKVYDFDGNTLTGDVKCGECNQYIYKSEDGCNLYGYDKLTNEQTCKNSPGDSTCIYMKDIENPRGVCTLGNIDDSTNNWKIDKTKKCPF